jgi:hypothetical protein
MSRTTASAAPIIKPSFGMNGWRWRNGGRI